MDGWPGPSSCHQGSRYWAHARHLGPAGKVYWQVAEPQCQSLAQHILCGFSRHMAVSVPTAEGLQMGCRVEVALVLEKAGVVCGVKPGAGLGTVNPENMVWRVEESELEPSPPLCL